jgi:hypothetical protein
VFCEILIEQRLSAISPCNSGKCFLKKLPAPVLRRIRQAAAFPYFLPAAPFGNSLSNAFSTFSISPNLAKAVLSACFSHPVFAKKGRATVSLSRPDMLRQHRLEQAKSYHCRFHPKEFEILLCAD